jgi:FkbM family methyltransferase
VRSFALTLPSLQGEDRRVDFTAPEGLYIGGVLQESGLAGYEPEALACFLGLMDIAAPGPVWDVGSNVGVYSLVASAVSGREVVAFEPTPHIAAAAREILSANHLTCEVRETALADAPGEAQLFMSRRTDASNSLREGFRRARGSITVPLETVDGLVEGGQHTPVILKIDTETTEPAVLRGAAATIAATRPWIMCEILPGRTEVELTAALEPHGYTWYLIEESIPYAPRDTLAGDPELLMWLFAPTPAPDELWERIGRWRTALAACTPA